MTPERRAELASLVAAAAHRPDDAGALDDETALIGGGWNLDSLALLELVVSIEASFGTSIGAADAGPEAFGTFGRLVAFLDARAEP